MSKKITDYLKKSMPTNRSYTYNTNGQLLPSTFVSEAHVNLAIRRQVHADGAVLSRSIPLDGTVQKVCTVRF